MKKYLVLILQIVAFLILMGLFMMIGSALMLLAGVSPTSIGRASAGSFLVVVQEAILFVSIVLSASDASRLDAEWLKKVDKLFKDLQIHSPFGLEPSIEELL